MDEARQRGDGPHAPGVDVDGIRYRLLGRLSGGARHALAGELQALQFAVELALRSAQVAPGERRVVDTLGQLKRQAQALSTTSRGIVDWLRPDEQARARLDDAVAQCLRIAGDDWMLRSIEATTSLQGGDAQVPQAAFRELVVAALYAISDGIDGAGDVALDARGEGSGAVVRISARRADREPAIGGVTAHPALDAGDVAALAGSRGVHCETASTGIVLRFT